MKSDVEIKIEKLKDWLQTRQLTTVGAKIRFTSTMFPLGYEAATL